MSLLAGMVAGSDPIRDVDRLRHIGTGLLFEGVHAPSTLGTSCGRSPRGSNLSVNAPVAAMPQTAWTPTHYPDAFVDIETGDLVSDAEHAEVGDSAFHVPSAVGS